MIEEIYTCIFCDENFITKDKVVIEVCDSCFEKYKEMFEKLSKDE